MSQKITMNDLLKFDGVECKSFEDNEKEDKTVYTVNPVTFIQGLPLPDEQKAALVVIIVTMASNVGSGVIDSMLNTDNDPNYVSISENETWINIFDDVLNVMCDQLNLVEEDSTNESEPTE